MKHVPGYPYTFNPEACKSCPGRCCNGERGNVWISQEEIEAVAYFLGIDIENFVQDYLRRVSGSYSIKDLKIGGNYACVFFDEKKNGCAIYPVRPEQCRTFPFWPHFREHPEKAFRECPGVTELGVVPDEEGLSSGTRGSGNVEN